MAACTEQRNAPVVEGLDSAEPALAAFLADRVASAQALPASAAMRGRLAMAYHANGLADAALASYAQAEKLDPGDPRWPYLGALLLAEAGAGEAALGNMDRALELAPAYAPAWLWRGTWLLDDDRNAQAADAFQHVLAAADSSSPSAAAESVVVSATVGLARVRLREGEPQEVVALLEPLVVDFTHPYPMRILAQAYRALGRVDDAKRYVERSREATPLDWVDERRDALTDHVRGFSGLLSKAETLIEQGRARAALGILEPLREDHPLDRVLLNNLAAAYGMTEQPQAVLDVLLPAVEQQQSSALIHFNLAAAYRDLGKPEAALRHVNEALALQPGLSAARDEQVALLVGAERYDEALAAVEVAERDSRQTAAMLIYAGLIEGYRERWSAAVLRFEQAIDLDSTQARVHLYLGHALIGADRSSEAGSAFALAAALGASPDDVAAGRARLGTLEEGR